MKCFYSNLPHDLTLVNNYREQGENYDVYRGPLSRTLLPNHVLTDTIASSDTYASSTKSLKSILSYFPSMEELSSWQLDFNLRRAGTLGDAKVIRNKDKLHDYMNESIHWFNLAINYLSIPPYSHISYSIPFWNCLKSLIEDLFWPTDSILHIGITPLVPILVPKIRINDIIIGNNLLCRNITSLLWNVSSIILKYRMRNSKLAMACYEHIKNLFVDEVALYNKKRSHDLVIIHLSILKYLQINISDVKYLLSDASFVMVIGNCAGAPTDISFEYLSVHSNENLANVCSDSVQQNFKTGCALKTHVNFTVIESVCEEGTVDKGFLLYRKTSEMQNQWLEKRHTVVRRLEGSLVHSRYFLKKTVEDMM